MRILGSFLMTYGLLSVVLFAPLAGKRDPRWWKRSRLRPLDARGWTRGRIVAAALLAIVGVAMYAVGLVLVYRS